MKIYPKILSPQIVEGVILNVLVFEEENSFNIEKEFISFNIGYYYILADMKKSHKIIQLKVIKDRGSSFILENGLEFSTLNLVNGNFVIYSIFKGTELFLNKDRIDYILKNKEIISDNFFRSFFQTLKLIFNNNLYYDSYYRDLVKKDKSIFEFHVYDYRYKLKFNVFKLFLFKNNLIKTIKTKKYENLETKLIYNDEVNCCSYWP